MLVFRGFRPPAPLSFSPVAHAPSAAPAILGVSAGTYANTYGAPSVLTLGNFDGVHRGHQVLLQQLITEARQLGLPATVVTFEPHPREFFAPAAAPARLTTLREKLEQFARLGVDRVHVIHFNRAFASLTPQAFVEEVLLSGLAVRHLMVGDDFRFGSGRGGDFAYLQQAGQAHGFSVAALHSVLVEGQRVSSSAVRQALAAGDMSLAARLLGRPYGMAGRVVHGRKLGRQLGFATANIYIKHNPLVMTGVFAVQVQGPQGELWQGVANLGIRPTVGATRPLLEIHLFDFAGDLYGAHLSVQFMHKLRDELKFPDLSALQARIAQDVQAARAFFRSE